MNRSPVALLIVGSMFAAWLATPASVRAAEPTLTEPTVTEYTAGLTPGSGPNAMTRGSDGAMWFSEFGSGDIGELDPATGELLGEYETPSGAASGPDGITRGPDGALWFAEQGEGLVGRIDPGTHEMTEYLIHQHASAGYKPSSIVTGPDGAL